MIMTDWLGAAAGAAAGAAPCGWTAAALAAAGAAAAGLGAGALAGAAALSLLFAAASETPDDFGPPDSATKLSTAVATQTAATPPRKPRPTDGTRRLLEATLVVLSPECSGVGVAGAELSMSPIPAISFHWWNGQRPGLAVTRKLAVVSTSSTSAVSAATEKTNGRTVAASPRST